ncbi:MAG: hypothetical protein OEO82_11260 [Gammaproteobacteria bacterium]|nr:hypothetical protein [Gammaproteobacteria bacterium]
MLSNRTGISSYRFGRQQAFLVTGPYADPDRRARLKPAAAWEIEGLFSTSSAQIFEAGMARAD